MALANGVFIEPVGQFKDATRGSACTNTFVCKHEISKHIATRRVADRPDPALINTLYRASNIGRKHQVIYFLAHKVSSFQQQLTKPVFLRRVCDVKNIRKRIRVWNSSSRSMQEALRAY